MKVLGGSRSRRAALPPYFHEYLGVIVGQHHPRGRPPPFPMVTFATALPSGCACVDPAPAARSRLVAACRPPPSQKGISSSVGSGTCSSSDACRRALTRSRPKRDSVKAISTSPPAAIAAISVSLIDSENVS